jgi:hypothetical protein
MSPEKSEKTLPLKAVYSYYFPEVRRIIDSITSAYPHETFLQSVTPGLDDYHVPVVSSYLRHFENQLPHLETFLHQYVTAGASESIFHLLARISAFEREKPLYLLTGEYEGYAGYGANLGLQFESVAEPENLIGRKPGIIFLSNPSARDGNIIDNDRLISICEAGHQIVYDVTYVGLTDPYRFNLNHPNIIAVLASLSKPFGLYYHRIGFAFTRFEMKTLEVNKWFKNILSLTIAREVLEQLGPDQLVNQYRSYQREALHTMEEQYHLHVDPSQVVLLGHAQNGQLPSGWENYSRRRNYRFCLTPYFLEQERSSSK